MISSKKSYAEQMLQFALALSLLQVDPESYLGRYWDTPLPIRNGDAWELEMLRAVPMPEYPYATGKAAIPLIEDLIRYDRSTTVTNYLDITAYLLNVQNYQTTNLTSDEETSTTTTTTTSTPAATSPSPPVVNLDLMVNYRVNTFNNSSSRADEIITNQDLEHFINAEIPLIDSLNPIDFEFERLSPLLSPPVEDELYQMEDDIPSGYNSTFEVKLEPYSSTSSVDLNFNNNCTSQLHFNGCHFAQNLDSFFDIFKQEPINDGEEENIDDINQNVPAQYESNEVYISEEVIIKSEESHAEQNNFNIPCLESNQIDTGLNNVEMTKEESELVEVLWKQDVGLGFSLSPPKISYNSEAATSSKKSDDDENEKLKAIEELKHEKKESELDKSESEIDDQWAGIPFKIDNETGEYIRLQLDDFLEDVLQLAELSNNNFDKEEKADKSNKEEDTGEDKSEQSNEKLLNSNDKKTNSEVSNEENTDELDEKSELSSDTEQSILSPLFDLDDANELEEEFDMMLQSASGPFGYHQPPTHHRSPVGPTHQNAYGSVMSNNPFRQAASFHHHHHQARVPPLSRSISMDQRIQDISSFFNPMGMGVGEMTPYSHYPNPYYQGGSTIQHGTQYPHNSVLHNASLAAEIGNPQPHYGHNVSSAVTSSMHLTNASHENEGIIPSYKLEHDMVYYSQLTTSEPHHNGDGFMTSILNDDDLQLMDMGTNEGFCSLRGENNTTSNNSSALGSSTGQSSQLIPSQISGMRNHPINGINNTSNIINTPISNETISTTGDRLDASSDSAVSSMGSERVPSLSDGEWGEGSDSAQDYHQGKFGNTNAANIDNKTHDFNCNRDSPRQPPIAQKKHQMYGKRYFQEQPSGANPSSLPHASNAILPVPQSINHLNSNSMKYEYDPFSFHNPGQIPIPANNLEGIPGALLGKEQHVSNMDLKYGWSGLDFPTRPPRTPHEIISHNHTYTLPQGSGMNPRPQLRDKKLRRSEEEHLTRDEKRARALNIPIPVNDIINLPMDEFNERLSKYDLTEAQLSLIRDIRRRGKNKVAAQNCRKRKLDQILSLEDEVKDVRRKKEQLFSEHDLLMTERNRVSNKFAALHKHIFQYLRDPDGNPCSPSEYSLQQAADGSVYLLRRDINKPVETNTSMSHHSTNRGNSTEASLAMENGYNSINDTASSRNPLTPTNTSHLYHCQGSQQLHCSLHVKPTPSSSQNNQKE